MEGRVRGTGDRQSPFGGVIKASAKPVVPSEVPEAVKPILFVHHLQKSPLGSHQDPSWSCARTERHIAETVPDIKVFPVSTRVLHSDGIVDERSPPAMPFLLCPRYAAVDLGIRPCHEDADTCLCVVAIAPDAVEDVTIRGAIDSVRGPVLLGTGADVGQDPGVEIGQILVVVPERGAAAEILEQLVEIVHLGVGVQVSIDPCAEVDTPRADGHRVILNRSRPYRRQSMRKGSWSMENLPP